MPAFTAAFPFLLLEEAKSVRCLKKMETEGRGRGAHPAVLLLPRGLIAHLRSFKTAGLAHCSCYG